MFIRFFWYIPTFSNRRNLITLAADFVRNFFFQRVLVLILTFPSLVFSFSADNLNELFQSGVSVDLRNPVYSAGVLSTTEGGVIETAAIRIQAEEIIYTRKEEGEALIWKAEARGKVMIETENHILIGKEVVYDFSTASGVLYEGKTMLLPWFVGGEKIDLNDDGSITIHGATVSTSEKKDEDWEILAKSVRVLRDSAVKASDITFRLLKMPFFWVPWMKMNLASFFDAPISLRVNNGDGRGLRLSAFYRIYKSEEWNTRLRFDASSKRGLGAGIEALYESQTSNVEFRSRSYYARDTSQKNPDQINRYLFEGIYNNDFVHKDIFWRNLFTYQKMSDAEMNGDYRERHFDFEEGMKTELVVNRISRNFLGRMTARARVNTFQTVRQKLPNIEVIQKPMIFTPLGIISQTEAEAGYLDFKFAKRLRVPDFNAIRAEVQQRLYRPFSAGWISLTPSITGIGVLYGNSQTGQEMFQGVLRGDIDLQATFWRDFSCYRHFIEPYAKGTHFTPPTVSSDRHYLFNIYDSFEKLTYLRAGLRSFWKALSNYQTRYCVDLYFFTFFNQDTLARDIPWLALETEGTLCPTISLYNLTIWDFERGEVGTLNTRLGWTFSRDLAFSVEYRRRNAFSWRKVHPENFMLDRHKTEAELAASSASDTRDTYLSKMFYRFHPNWALELTTRHGRRRVDEPSYNEYQIAVMTTVSSAWEVRLAYQSREADNNLNLSVNLKPKDPRKLLKIKEKTESKNVHFGKFF